MSTEQFVAFLRSELMAKNPGAITDAELSAWLSAPGIPAFAPQTASPRFDAVDATREAWVKRRTAARELKTAEWTTQEWVYFLEGLPRELPAERLVELDQAFRFTGTANGEIAQRWYPLTVRSGYRQADGEMAAFLKKIGRRKLIMPTYDALVKTPEGLELAEEVFAKARPGYHPITTGSVESVIAGAKQQPAAGATPQR